MKYDNILQTIGDTPIIKLNRIGPDHVELYVKVEAFNPLASVKDRLAYAIIKDARDSGELQPGQTVGLREPREGIEQAEGARIELVHDVGADRDLDLEGVALV